jgi:peptidoglycan/xylan/chitin deacetylase (PgdA/CDA1 family)
MPRFDRLATLYLSFPLTCFLGPRQRTRVPILMYHSISDHLFGMSHPYYHINTLPEVFSQQMRWLRNRGYRAVDLAEAWAGLQVGDDLSKTVVLTFDDGYRDFYTDADLRSLVLDQLEYELGHSKEIIEQHLGVPVDSFSYPFAFPEEDKDFMRYLEDLLNNLGFEYGVSTILGRASRKSNRFFLPRLPVNNWDDISMLRAKVEGGYDWLHWPQLLKKVIFHHATIMQQSPKAI